MIKFLRNEKTVKIEIEHGIFGNENIFELDIHQSFDYQAELLRKQLNENMNRHLKQLKEKYYNEGWKHAKAKTRKRTSFFGDWKF